MYRDTGSVEDDEKDGRGKAMEKSNTTALDTKTLSRQVQTHLRRAYAASLSLSHFSKKSSLGLSQPEPSQETPAVVYPILQPFFLLDHGCFLPRPSLLTAITSPRTIMRRLVTAAGTLTREARASCLVMPSSFAISGR